MIAAAIPDGLSLVDVILGIVIVVGGAIFAVSQWRNGKYKALELANSAILQELEAQKERGDRLEKELHGVTTELIAMRAENKTLRDLVMGAAVPNAMTDAIAEIVGKGTATAIQSIGNKLDAIHTDLVHASGQRAQVAKDLADGQD